MNKQNQLSPEKYIITKGGQLPFHECFVNEGWQEKGMATLVISKKMPSGKLIVATYLIDSYCLGLKDTFYKFALDEFGYSDFLDQLNEQQGMIKCDLNFAHNIIYGAIDYAQELGFTPNKDFKITEYLLDSDLIDDGIDELVFGMNGKPTFIAGPYDNAKMIVSTLEKNVGTGNYEYIISPY